MGPLCHRRGMLNLREQACRQALKQARLGALLPSDVRLHQQAKGAVFRDGHVLTAAQAEIAPGGLVVAFGEGEGFLLPGEQTQIFADGENEHARSLSRGSGGSGEVGLDDSRRGSEQAGECLGCAAIH